MLRPVFLPLLPLPSPPHPTWQGPLTPAPPLQAQRNNEDISIIPPLFTVSVDHRVSGLKKLTWSQGKQGGHNKPHPFGGWGVRAGA